MVHVQTYPLPMNDFSFTSQLIFLYIQTTHKLLNPLQIIWITKFFLLAIRGMTLWMAVPIIQQHLDGFRFCIDIHGPQRMNHNHFDSPLTFRLE